MWTVNICFVSYCHALIKRNVDIWAALCPVKVFSHCACSWPKSPTGVMSPQVCRKSLCSAEVFLTMRPLCSSGCQSVCSRVLLTSNLHLNFRLMTFLSHFTRPIFLWRDYVWATSETQWLQLHDTHCAEGGFDTSLAATVAA